MAWRSSRSHAAESKVALHGAVLLAVVLVDPVISWQTVEGIAHITDATLCLRASESDQLRQNTNNAATLLQAQWSPGYIAKANDHDGENNGYSIICEIETNESSSQDI